MVSSVVAAVSGGVTDAAAVSDVVGRRMAAEWDAPTGWAQPPIGSGRRSEGGIAFEHQPVALDLTVRGIGIGGRPLGNDGSNAVGRGVTGVGSIEHDAFSGELGRGVEVVRWVVRSIRPDGATLPSRLRGLICEVSERFVSAGSGG